MAVRLQHAVLAGLAAAGLTVAAIAWRPSHAAAVQPVACTVSDQSDRAACGWAISTLGRMTLEEKVGQLFVTYAYGTTADTADATDVAANRNLYGLDNAGALIGRYKLGGVIYFSWADNVNTPAQIAGLSNGIQQVATHQRVPVPMLIGTDQEHGIVVRVTAPATQFPGNMALGAGRSTADAATAATISGQELRAIGINQDFAPDSDVNVNPANPVIGVRSFSADPTLAAQLVGATVTAYRNANVAATAKHFPGHGDTNVDSHTGIPVINHTRAQWEQLDRPPFAAAIAAGVDSIMTAHIVVPALDPSGDPATLSAPIMTGMLRGDLHYTGVVITDSLGMEGVRAKYGDDRVPVLALKAGVDQLLMPPNLDLAYHSVLNAVHSGELTEQRIDQSVVRILRLKYKRGLVTNPLVDPARIGAVVGTQQHLAAAQALTDRTVTLVRNDGGPLPLAPGSGARVLVTGWGVSTTATLAADIARRGITTQTLQTGISPTQAQISAAASAATGKDLVVVTTNTVQSNPQQARLLQALLATGKPVVAVAVNVPYDIASFPTVPGYLATYGYTAGSLESATRVLFGEVNPTGKLPVAIPAAGSGATLYPLGFGLGYDR
jgi:beta-N-acetylhexosaminidase